MSRRKGVCVSPKRRELLRYALAGGAAAIVGLGSARAGLLSHVRRILAGAPADSGALHLLAQAIVFGDRHPIVAIDQWSTARLGHRIRANIEADYRRGNIVALGAWRISATEANALELMRRLQLT